MNFEVGMYIVRHKDVCLVYTPKDIDGRFFGSSSIGYIQQ